jgi:hypothetical protein
MEITLIIIYRHLPATSNSTFDEMEDDRTEFLVAAVNGGVDKVEVDAEREKETVIVIQGSFNQAALTANIFFNYQGSCVVCKGATTKRCQACADTTSGRPAPFYCGKEHQKEDWSQHKLSCLRTRISKFQKAYKNPRKPVDFLVKCIVEDVLPALDSPCYEVFGFSNCKTEREEANLLSLYVGLIKLLETDIDEVGEALEKGELAQLISKEYETLRPDPETRGEYFPWFQKNMHIVQVIPELV